MISGDGLRWFVANFMDNIRFSPWDYILMLSLTVSVVKESEIFSFRNKIISLKQKRAYYIVGILLAIIASLVIVCTILPGNVLLSAFGTFNNSPLQHGLFPIISIFIIVISLVFGFSTGRFASLEEMVRALVALLVNIASYFVSFLVASQLCAIIKFAFLNNDFTEGNGYFLYYFLLSIVLFYIPWLLHVIFAFRKS